MTTVVTYVVMLTTCFVELDDDDGDVDCDVFDGA